MKPFLDPTLTYGDEVLIREINITASEIKERKQKQQAEGAIRVQTIAASVEMNTFMEMVKPLMETVSTLTSEMASLKKEVSKISRPTQNSWKRRVCDSCTKGNVDSCNHCWKFSKAGHF